MTRQDLTPREQNTLLRFENLIQQSAPVRQRITALLDARADALGISEDCEPCATRLGAIMELSPRQANAVAKIRVEDGDFHLRSGLEKMAQTFAFEDREEEVLLAIVLVLSQDQ